MATGTHDYQFLDFGTVLTTDRAAALQTNAGVPFASIMRAANNAMAAATNVSAVARSLTVQTDNDVAGEEPSANFQVEYGSEYSVALPQRGEEISHLLPIRKLDIATQWTEDFLDNASERQIAVTLNGLTEAFQKAYEVMTLNALFNIDAVPITENSSTTSPKFIGYDSGDPAYGKVTLSDGTVITSPYSHYIRDTSANVLVALKAALTRLKARGETGPFDVYPTANAADALSGATGFVDAGDAFVRPAQGDAEALVDSDIYIGVIRGLNVRIRKPLERVLDDSTTASWFAVVRTFGDNAEGNPIAWLYSPKYGLTPRLRSRSQYPLDYATAINRAGFGVANRFGAALVKLAASGSYTSPSIRA